jgi:hypothetical protein
MQTPASIAGAVREKRYTEEHSTERVRDHRSVLSAA